MLTKTGRFALATAMLWLVFGAGGRAAAGGIALSTPAGLSPGDTFRVAFVTDGTTTATSSSIGNYNTFVTNDASTEAGGGVVTYNGVTLTWTAIASTPYVAAITIIGTYGVPVYLASGTQVTSSDNASGLWSGSLTNSISQDLHGNYLSGYVWTGTMMSGAAFAQFELGGPPPYVPVTGYNTKITDGQWVDQYGIGWDASGTLPMYGISQVLTVTSAVAVPEPSTLWMAASGICAGVAYRWNRRRRQQRR